MKRYDMELIERYTLENKMDKFIEPTIAIKGKWVKWEDIHGDLKFILNVLTNGKETINDDNGETELVLTSGDEWVACMSMVKNLLGEGE